VEADGVVIDLLHVANVVEVAPQEDTANRIGTNQVVGGDGAAVAPHRVLAQVDDKRLFTLEFPALGQPGLVIALRPQVVGHRQLDPAVVQADAARPAGGEAVQVAIRRQEVRPGAIEGARRRLPGLPDDRRDAGQQQGQQNQNG